MICVYCTIMKNACSCSFKHDGIPINLSVENPLVLSNEITQHVNSQSKNIIFSGIETVDG